MPQYGYVQDWYTCKIGAPQYADALSAENGAALDTAALLAGHTYVLRARFLFRVNKGSLDTALCAPRCTPQLFVAFQSVPTSTAGIIASIVALVVFATIALFCLSSCDPDKRRKGSGSGTAPNRTVPMNVEAPTGAPVTDQELVSGGASNSLEHTLMRNAWCVPVNFANGNHCNTTFLGRENPQSVNLANNDITVIDGLHQCHNLRVLNLSNNFLTQLHGIVAAPALVKLDVSDNALVDLGGLQSASLQMFICRNNDITTLSSMISMGRYAEPTFLPALQIIDAQDNSIASLQGVEGFPALRTANFANNNIHAIASIQQCINLQSLDVRANELDSAKEVAPNAIGGAISEASNTVLLNIALVLQFLTRVDVRLSLFNLLRSTVRRPYIQASLPSRICVRPPGNAATLTSTFLRVPRLLHCTHPSTPPITQNTTLLDTE